LRAITPFDINDLECEALMNLFQEAASHIQDIRIEIVTNRRNHRDPEEHPATALGIAVQRPTIQFSQRLDRKQRIDAIAHELLHILLVYRHGLKMVDRKIPWQGSNQEIFDYYFGLNKYWNYFLEQMVNTVHHRILIDYLKEEYGISSDFHLALFRHNFHIVAKRYYPDKESQYAKGLVAYEYEGTVGEIGRAVNFRHQSEFFWKAYCSAKKFFEAYSFKKIPEASVYEENLLSFLEDLGYRRQDFAFFPEAASDTPAAPIPPDFELTTF